MNLKTFVISFILGIILFSGILFYTFKINRNFLFQLGKPKTAAILTMKNYSYFITKSAGAIVLSSTSDSSIIVVSKIAKPFDNFNLENVIQETVTDLEKSGVNFNERNGAVTGMVEEFKMGDIAAAAFNYYQEDKNKNLKRQIMISFIRENFNYAFVLSIDKDNKNIEKYQDDLYQLIFILTTSEDKEKTFFN